MNKITVATIIIVGMVMQVAAMVALAVYAPMLVSVPLIAMMIIF